MGPSRTVRRSHPMKHDAIHKLLCSFPRVIADILSGYVGGDVVGRMDFDTLEQVSAERVTQALKRRLNDSVWRVRCDDGRLVWVYLALEFQSEPDPNMEFRMLGYVAALYEELGSMKEFRGPRKVPAVMGAVLYNGERQWVRELDTRARIALGRGSDLEGMLPRIKFPVIDERRSERPPDELRNAAGLMFRFWTLQTVEDLQELVAHVKAWLRGPEDSALREAFETVIEEEVIPAYFGEGSALQGARGFSTIEDMLIGNVEPFAVQYERRGRQKGREEGREKGREEGREKGREEGREEIRGIYVRMALARFGVDVSESLAVLLRPVGSLGLLGQVGDMMVTAETGEDLLASVANLAESEPADSAARA